MTASPPHCQPIPEDARQKDTPKPTFDPAYIRDISEAVYRHELGDDDAERMMVKDKDTGQMLRNRAAAYDRLTRVYLKALGFEPPQPGSVARATQERGK